MRVGRLRDIGQRADHRAAHDDDIQCGEKQGREPKREQVGGSIMVLIGEFVRLAGTLLVDALERLDIAVELTAHCPVGVVVAPFAPRGRADLHSAPHQLLAEFDELRDALAECSELPGIILADGPLHALHGVSELAVTPYQPISKLLHRAAIGGHVDAARFHHDGVAR